MFEKLSTQWLVVILGLLALVFVGIVVLIVLWFNYPQQETKDKIENKATTPEVGTLTAYYAKEDFNAGDHDYKKGQLICDSNNPTDRIVDLNGNNYKYEGDDTGEYYSWLLPKSKVEKKEYKMNQLPVAYIGKKKVFVTDKGNTAKIFWSNYNGHKYCDYDGNERWRDTERLMECFVLSASVISKWDGHKYLFEEQLEESQGNIKLYSGNEQYGGDDPSSCRYKEGPIGFIEEKWYNKEGWREDKTAYSDDGKLLVDQYSSEGDIPCTFSIAYIGALNALYIEGDLYYAQ